MVKEASSDLYSLILERIFFKHFHDGTTSGRGMSSLRQQTNSMFEHLKTSEISSTLSAIAARFLRAYAR